MRTPTRSGDIFPNAGYTKVTVGPTSVKVEYIREWLPQDEKPPAQVSGMVQFAYTIPASGGAASPTISGVVQRRGRKRHDRSQYLGRDHGIESRAGGRFAHLAGFRFREQPTAAAA